MLSLVVLLPSSQPFCDSHSRPILKISSLRSSMNLPHFQKIIFPSPVTRSCRVYLPVTCYFRRKTTPKQLITHQITPARDRVIDFGKYEGRMLGTLPSTYLKWVSKNLRARDFEEWAKLADQVLQDPIYKDRIEWEFAENVLNGNKSKALSSFSDGETTAVSDLMGISERFGWDNKDKVGWGKINFELLGTSKGGRIPRLEKSENRDNETLTKQKERGLEVLSEVGGRRRERRERQKKTRSEAQTQAMSGANNNKRGINEESRGDFVNEIDGDSDVIIYQSQRQMGNPFPGREALLRKASNRRRIR